MVGAPERGNWVAHELLLALLGYTGDVFTAEHRRSIGAKATASTAARTLAMTKEDELGEEDIDAELEVRVVLSAAARQSFPSAAECEVLERAVELGGHAITLRHLSDALTGDGLGNAEGTSGRSLYWRAVATGIGEVLDVYAESVLRLEGVILGGAGSTECSSSICGLQSAELADARAYLPHMIEMCRRILRRRLRGAPLLLFVRACARGGDPAVRESSALVMRHCMRVLHRQLASWMIYGRLHDPHGEFFIHRVGDDASGDDAHMADGGTGGRGRTDPRAGADPPMGSRGRRPGDFDSTSDWHNAFAVRLSCLPPDVAVRTAEKVLFIGKAARVLHNPEGDFKKLATPLISNEETLKLGEALHALIEREDGGGVAASSCPSFTSGEFEAAIERIRLATSSRLWDLVVNRAKLLSHLHLMKDFFLLARGDFWHGFLLESDKILSMPPSRGSAEISLNTAFQVSGLKCNLDADGRSGSLFSRLKLRLARSGDSDSGGDDDDEAYIARHGGVAMASSPSTSSYFSPSSSPAMIVSPRESARKRAIRVPSFDSWDGLKLDYNVDWPLGLLLTRNVLARYNVLFRFLLRLRRVQRRLDDVWSALRMASKARRVASVPSAGDGGGFDDGNSLELWHLHQHMSYLITNLQIYVQIDVIESQFRTLIDRISNAEDFAEAERAHEAYLSALFGQTFLDISTISRLLEELFSQIREFCSVVTAATTCDDRQGGADGGGRPGVAKLAAAFGRVSSQLYTILRGNTMKESSRVPSLRQLLLRLNYNDFFVREATRVIRTQEDN